MKRLCFRLLLVALILLVLPSVSSARAGGGHDYGGGGGDGGGGGGEGFGILLYYLIQLVIYRPAIGIPLLIVVIFISIKVRKSARTGIQTATISRAGRVAREREQADLESRLTALESGDPGFSREAFLTRASSAFVEIQKAWSAQDMSKARRFVSDGIRERFELQIGMQKAENFRNDMSDVKVVSRRIVAMQSDRAFDTLHVEIVATASDRDVELSSGRVLRSRPGEPFTEYWSFLRKPGARTAASGGLVEGLCPNCGAGLELSDQGRCAHCDSIVSSGEYDWILAEITQAMEWGTTGNPSLVPGWDDMLGKDPAFNLQHVEDRTSVIFWRYIRAHFDSTVEALRKVASPEWLDEFAKRQILSRQGDRWLHFREAAVGAVEVQRLVPGPPGGRDRAEVLVRWSARNSMRTAGGKVENAGDRMIRPVVFLLERDSEVATRADMTFMSAHCQGCGAPFEGGDSGNCSYCGRVLNDGSQDWVLTGMEAFDPSRFVPASVDAIGRASLVPPDLVLAAMASTMHSDGEIDPSEEAELRRFAAANGVRPPDFDEILSSVRAGAELPRPGTPKEAREILASMVRMALADGKVQQSELALLTKFAEASGLARADVTMVLARERADLFREAKELLKNRGRS
ncbi:TIM44-like domain-containing protein [Candidatus Fermentibacteria bacterium]|nr:TIM44-like domain-containing protein [Candidatus Fermentibacteria bacterium]